MKFVFFDKNESEMGIITGVLNAWNVPYHIKNNGFYTMFGKVDNYDIEIDTSLEFRDFLQGEIDKVLTLQKCFDLPCAEPSKPTKSKKRGRPKKVKSEPNKQIENKMETPFSLADILCSFLPGIDKLSDEMDMSGQIVTFEELSSEEQSILTQRFPISILKSDNTVITKTPFGLKVKIGG